MVEDYVPQGVLIKDLDLQLDDVPQVAILVALVNTAICSGIKRSHENTIAFARR